MCVCVSVCVQRSGNSLLDQQLTGDNVPVIVDRCLRQVDSRGETPSGVKGQSSQP